MPDGVDGRRTASRFDSSQSLLKGRLLIASNANFDEFMIAQAAADLLDRRLGDSMLPHLHHWLQVMSQSTQEFILLTRQNIETCVDMC